MRVLKCDFCKKVIKNNKSVNAGLGYLNGVELCEKCGKPVLNFLKNNKVIKTKDNKGLSNK